MGGQVENIALHKKVIEPEVMQPQYVTNGDTENYDGHKGFAYFKIPGTLTLDLEEVSGIKCIRVLLWDGLGKNGPRNDRKYKYSIAISRNNSEWLEIFRTADEGTTGWQIFKFTESISTKYIRIYGLSNTANNNFHIVEIEAYNDFPKNPEKQLGIYKQIDVNLAQERTSIRIDSKGLNKLIENLEKQPIIDKDVVKDIKKRFDDLIILDQNLNAVRNEIVQPVRKELLKANKLSITALIITIVGLLISILLQIKKI